jgi:formate C-acetyltransferase
MLLQWHGFTEGNRTKEVNVRDFIQKNYTPYEGNAEFLTAPTEKTQQKKYLRNIAKLTTMVY